jgi:hypothetical protein
MEWNAAVRLRNLVHVLTLLWKYCQQDKMEMNIMFHIQWGTSINDVRQFSMIIDLHTYLPTMSDNFYLITSDFWESFWTYLPTLKSDVINGLSHAKICLHKMVCLLDPPKCCVQQYQYIPYSPRYCPNYLHKLKPYLYWIAFLPRKHLRTFPAVLHWYFTIYKNYTTFS